MINALLYCLTFRDTAPNNTSIASPVCHAQGWIFAVAPAPTRNISPDVLKSR